MTTRKATVKISVSIDNALLDWVDRQCDDQHTNRSRFFNRLIVDSMLEVGFDRKKKGTP